MSIRSILGLSSPVSPVTRNFQSMSSRSVDAVSLLGDYSRLEAGKRGNTLLRYKKPGVAWGSYASIKLDPVTIWQEPGALMFDVGAADRQKLADKFYGLLHESLSRTHRIVSMPLAHTLRIQVAFTDARKINPAMDTVSTILPLGSVISQTANFSRQCPSIFGSASLEVKVSDAADGDLLAAGVARNVGGEYINSSTRTWAEVLNSMECWANYLAWQLDQVSGNHNSQKPRSPNPGGDNRRLVAGENIRH